MPSDFSKDSVARYADASREKFEKTLKEIVEIPTVSVEPEHKADMARGAKYAADLLESMGARARVYPTAGHPFVHGRFVADPSFPTVTIYNHLDVQPADGPDWKTEPFRFTRDGETYFGRGTTDDKGPAISALFGAKYAMDNGARGGKLIGAGGGGFLLFYAEDKTRLRRAMTEAGLREVRFRFDFEGTKVVVQ